jgi:hypothetical protein
VLKNKPLPVELLSSSQPANKVAHFLMLQEFFAGVVVPTQFFVANEAVELPVTILAQVNGFM